MNWSKLVLRVRKATLKRQWREEGSVLLNSPVMHSMVWCDFTQQDPDSCSSQPGWHSCAHCLFPGWSIIFRNAWSHVRAQVHIISSGLEALVLVSRSCRPGFPRRGRQGAHVASYNPQGFCKFCKGQYCVPHYWHQLPHSSCPRVIKKCQLLMWPTLLSVDGGGANLYWAPALSTSHNQMMGGPWLVNAISHRAA